MSRACFELNLKLKALSEVDLKRRDAVNQFLQWLCEVYGVDRDKGESLGEIGEA